MRTLYFLFFMIQYVLAYAANESTYETNALKININEETGVVNSLVTSHNNINWKTEPGKIYSNTNENCKEKIFIEQQQNGQIKFDLELKNTSATKQLAYVTFPLLENLYPGGNIDDLHYLYPQQGTAISNIRYYHANKYSGKFPHQFIDVFHETYGGIFFMTEDTVNLEKDYWLEKTTAGINTGCTYKIILEPNETIELPSNYIGGHRGDWHDAMDAYKSLLAEWFKPMSPRKKWFLDIYNLRQHFLHDNYGDKTYNSTTKEFSIYKEIQKDIEEFGGVDYVHIFDWSKQPNVGRVGNYDPGEIMEDATLQNFIKEIEKIQNNEINVGLYFEGYLFSKGFDDGSRDWADWQIIINSDGTPSTRWGEEYYHMCPYVTNWQEYLAYSCKNATSLLNTFGVYLDQLGFAWQDDYKCYNSEHGHKTPSFIPAGEMELLKKVRNSLPTDKVLYTEETPVDVNMQYQDGSFSYTINSQINVFNDSRINLTRFIVPDYKNFHIINVDGPMGTPTDKLNIIFFNGEGLWISGPISSYTWFPQETRDLIKKNYNILHQYKDAFSSSEPEPLVPTMKSRLYANKFPSENITVWTIFNRSESNFDGEEIISVDHSKGATYYDSWNDYPLNPRIENDKAYLKVKVGANNIGCIVQKKK